ncbi:type II secretion system protein GspD [Halarcobacter ebronensis]|uniref:General secretion pathway protein GspD n=1 Tax=Halarcobacter ebronensis TaxID=1462615 RepID=A0A4Q1AF20_9BACT|nr:secretin N-terminal domain-containing protein [Halarcobacter ebronensis]QKF82655.1 type II secretion/transformation system, D protein [Halarcobacter ebronensis]RXK02078.1 general secretion pathway protein GspD [Halarcobacter ebronensis]
MKHLLFFLLFVTFSFCNDYIDVNIKGLTINELIIITSKVIGKNILTTQKIDASVNFVSNKPIKKSELLDILKISLKSNGYELIKENDILKVVKNENTRVKKIDKIQNRITKNSNRVKELIFLSNVEAKNLQTVLENIVLKKEDKEACKIAIDEELNVVILSGKEDEVKELKELVKKMDKQREQIYVKAKIVELDDNMVEEIGLQYGILGGKSYSGGIYTFSNSLNSGDAIAINTQAIGLEIPNVTSTIALGATLNLLNRTYALDIISEPSLLCINNKESQIYVGETISLQTGTTVTDGGNQTITYEREDIGLTLKVKPRVFKEKKVVLKIDTLVESIKNRVSINANPDTTKKQIITEAILNNGESVIIGGLTEKRNEKSVEKVPLLGEVPLIGELFKNRATTLNSKNLIIIITPYIIPSNKDLTYVREELAKLKSLEDKFLEESLKRLKDKQKKENRVEDSSTKQKYSKEVKEYFGI